MTIIFTSHWCKNTEIDRSEVSPVSIVTSAVNKNIKLQSAWVGFVKLSKKNQLTTILNAPASIVIVLTRVQYNFVMINFLYLTMFVNVLYLVEIASALCCNTPSNN